MTTHRLMIFTLLAAALLAGPAHAQQTEGERRLLESRKESQRLTRDAADPVKPLVATDSIVPDVDDLAERFARTKAKLKPDYLAAYRPGPAHEVLSRLGCKVLGATPLGARMPSGELHMETLVFRCADGAQGRLTVSRDAPPDIHVELDDTAVTGRIANRPAVVRYFRAEKSRRLVIVQSWMAGPDHLLNLEYVLPAAPLDPRNRTIWAKGREMALALDQAYAPPR